MDLIQAIILGIVQGLTEFLPVSSSAHIRIVPALMGWQDPGAAFTANIQLGTIVAVLIYFRIDLAAAIKGWAKSLTNKEARSTPEARMGWAVFVGTFPILILGYLLRDLIESKFRNLDIVAFMLIFMAILLFIAEKFGKRQRQVEDVTWKDGLLIGLWQAVALIPGASRSGSTITGGLFGGFDRAAAARISFLLSVPAIILAAVKTAYDHREQFSTMLTPLIVANVASLIVGYACIAWLMKLLQSKSTIGFIVYRIALGLAIFGMLSAGTLKPDAGAEPIPPEATASR